MDTPTSSYLVPILDRIHNPMDNPVHNIIVTRETKSGMRVLAIARAKEAISLRIDADVLDWFRAGGVGYQTRMNAVLRAYMRSCPT